MNTNIEEVQISANGLCNFCSEWDQIKDKYTNFSEKEQQSNLESIKNKIKKNKNDTKYDCIIGLSGGVDSSYVTLLAWKLKLNPLIIHMDNGWNSRISNLNINKILEKTNFDYETLILDWNEFKDLQKSFLRAGVPDIEILTDHAIFAYILNYSLDNKIKHIISGVNFATEFGPIPSWGWRKDDFFHINKIHKKFGKHKIKTFPKMFPLKKFFYEKLLKKINYINILDFINYNSTKAKIELRQNFDWEDYGGKHHESFFTKFFQGYILPKKFNIDKRIIHYSCMIRNKEISKNEATAKMLMPQLETQKIEEYKNFFLKKLDLSDKEFENIMSQSPKKHSDYSYDYYNNIVFKFIRKILK